jgi:hypothetical protein
MSNVSSRLSMRRLGVSVVATIATLCLLLAVTTSVLASTVHVYDNANVLNASQVQSAAANLPYPIDIYTVNNFNGSKAAFQQQTATHTAGNPNLIVLAIDTRNRYVFVSSGSRVPLSSSQATDAANSFASNFNSGYTNATLAAINSLQNSLRSSSGNNSGSPYVPAPAAGPFGGFGTGTLCCIGLLVLAAIALFAFFRRRRPSGGLFGGRTAVPPYNPPYNQPYNQGYPPPNYGPGYNQGGGIGPLGAGGLGAAAGGFLGYELGKQAGEREARDDQFQGNNFGDGGAFGGSGGADFGGSGGADFGGGGGADFGGGGGGGDFGGGSDFGGGGGGSGGSNF